MGPIAWEQIKQTPLLVLGKPFEVEKLNGGNAMLHKELFSSS